MVGTRPERGYGKRPQGELPGRPGTLHQVFQGSEQFASLLVRQGVRVQEVVARTYGRGAWSQFSGRDLAAHLGRAAADWERQLGGLVHDTSQWAKEARCSLLFLTQNTYASMVAGMGALLAGFDVAFVPLQASQAEITRCLEVFGGCGLVTDRDELVGSLGGYGKPVFNLGGSVWIAQDPHPFPRAFELLRASRMVSRGGRLEDEPLVRRGRLGRVQFLSFGNDGFQRPEELDLDCFPFVAQSFLQHLGAPPGLFWQTMELLPTSTPLCHLAQVCVLLRNGILGFPHPPSSWEANVQVLRPTVLFTGPEGLGRVVQFADEVASRQQFRGKAPGGTGRLGKAQDFLQSWKAQKYPERFLGVSSRVLRRVSRFSAGRKLVDAATGDLRLIVHGLGPVAPSRADLLARYGVAVVETYGVTAACGLLSSNVFESPYAGVIGWPLPHVSFRLGSSSVLEYQFSQAGAQVFGGSAVAWRETGDMGQMSPKGFVICGRKKHLFLTAGGGILSPVQVEQMFRAHEWIRDVCLVGDKLPFLAALIALNPETYGEWLADPGPVEAKVMSVIASVNGNLPRNATIKKFLVLDRPFQEADGERLASGGLNRLRILETRRHQIQALYGLPG